MAQVDSKHMVRTNVHRKKIADVCANGQGSITKFVNMQLGDAGKDAIGQLKVPNGAVPRLFNAVKIVPITRLERVNDFEYVVYAEVNTSQHTDLVGKDITERAILDQDDTLAVIETFLGFGPLQANKTYEYAIRFLVV